MKGIRITLVAVVIIIVVGLGVAMLNSGGERRQPVRTNTPAPSPAPRVDANKPKSNSSIQMPAKTPARGSGTGELEPPPIFNATGFDAKKEKTKFDQLEEEARSAMKGMNYQRAIEIRREQMKSAVRMAKLQDTGVLHVEISRAELLRGNLEAADRELGNALIMADLAGGKNPHVKDDVELMRADIAMIQGKLDVAEKKLAEAKRMRSVIEGDGHYSLDILPAHEALLEDFKGNYEKADQLFDEALGLLVQKSSQADVQRLLEDSKWLFQRSLAVRSQKAGADSDAVKNARQRVEMLK